MVSAHVKHLKKPQTTSSGNVKDLQTKEEPYQRMLERWNTLLMEVDMIMASMHPGDVYVLRAFIDAIKIRM
jgi:hypothetical protein